MKIIITLAALFFVIGLTFLYLTAPSLAIVVIVLMIAAFVIYTGVLATIYAYHRLGQAKLTHAQAFATTIEAAKIPDNVQALAMPINSRIQITVLPSRPTITISQPALAAALPEPVAAGPIEIPTVHFFDHVPADPYRQGELYLRLGATADGKMLTRPITKLTHFLPAGKTNSGKSTFLRALAGQALIGELAAPGRARIALIDLSGITFNSDLFAGLPQTWDEEVAQSDQAAIATVNSLLKECERRARLYSQAPGLPESLPEYNAVVPPAMRLPVIMTFIEEISALAEFAGKPFLSPLKQLIWTARKFGIYLINTGQDFRSNVIDKSITDNSSSRFMFGGIDDITARVIGFDPKQHRVSVDQPGRGLVMLNKQVSEFQGLYLEKTDFVALVNQLRINAGLREVGKGAYQATSQATATNHGSYSRIEYNPPHDWQEPLKTAYNGAKVENVVTADYRELPPPPEEIARALKAYQSGATSVRAMRVALACSQSQASELLRLVKERYDQRY